MFLLQDNLFQDNWLINLLIIEKSKMVFVYL